MVTQQRPETMRLQQLTCLCYTLVCAVGVTLCTDTSRPQLLLQRRCLALHDSALAASEAAFFAARTPARPRARPPQEPALLKLRQYHCCFWEGRGARGGAAARPPGAGLAGPGTRPGEAGTGPAQAGTGRQPR